MRRSLPLAVLFATVIAFPLACGSSNKQDAKAGFSFSTAEDGGAPPASNCPPGAPCPPANCAPGQPCPPPAMSSAPPLGSVYTNDPNALAQLLAAAAAAGSAMLGPAAAMADPAEAGLRTATAKYAPGMTAEGQVAKGNLSEGGHVGFVVNMDATKCYTVVAYGAGVTDLDVNLLAPPFYNVLAGQDGMAGPTAVIGAAPRPMCPLVPLAVPYKSDLYAKKGGGAVAAQVYSKPK